MKTVIALAAAFAALFAVVAAPAVQARPLLAGTSGRDVQQWQKFLAMQGLMRTPLDGRFDGRTQTATAYFQRACGLRPTGVVDGTTLTVAQRVLLREIQVAQQQNTLRRQLSAPRPAPSYSVSRQEESHAGMDYDPALGSYLPHNPYSSSPNSYLDNWVNQFKNPYNTDDSK